jgi:hypothetical protein
LDSAAFSYAVSFTETGFAFAERRGLSKSFIYQLMHSRVALKEY